jgi:Fic family protein
MLSDNPKISFSITTQNLQDLQSLENRIIKAYATLLTLSEDERQAIHQYARISTIGASTRIENAQLTDIEIDWMDTILSTEGKSTAFENNRALIENKLSKDRERSIEEVAGCRNMLFIIYSQGRSFLPLREADIRSLHHELLLPYKGAQHYIGRYKEQPNYVVQEDKHTGDRRIVFPTADAGPITQSAMSDLVRWYNEIYEENTRTIPIAAEFVFRFLAIHPFQDGNGRLGRGLFLLLLLQSQNEAIAKVAPYLPIDRYIERNKEEYYFVLNKCSGGIFRQDPLEYKINYFFEYMLKILSASLDSINVYRKRYEATKNLSDTSRLILKCFKEHPEIRLNTKMIVDEINLPVRTVNYNLSVLLELDLIQRSGRGSAIKYQLVF